MSHLGLAIIHVLLGLTLQGNFSVVAFAFPTSATVSRTVIPFLPPSSTKRGKSQQRFSPMHRSHLSSFLSDSAMGENLLSYLPNRGQDMPPDFLQLVQGATTRYSNPSSFTQGEDLGGMAYIMEVIDFEYKISSKRPVTVQNVTYANQQNVTKLLSVCLFHQLPAPIVLELLRECNNGRIESSDDNKSVDMEEKQVFRTCLQAMEKDGWKAFAFPEGIRVQVRPSQVCSTWKDELPPRKVSPEMADALLEKAHVATTPPPPISLKESRQSKRTTSKLKRRSGKERTREPEPPLVTFPGTSIAVPFFPRDRVTVTSKVKERITTFLSKVQSRTQKLTEKLNQAGRAGFLAYGFLNLAVYAGGTLLQWHRISVSGPPTIASQVQRLGKVLGTVYVGSQVTKLPRIALAVALAPAGNRSLDWLRDKLGVSEGTAFGILTAALIGTFFAVVGTLIVGSTILG